MSQNDYVIANQTAPNFRADLNLALQALASNSSGATAPATTYANMLWYDTANNILKMRSEADDAWINLGTLDQSANTFTPAGQVAVIDEDDFATDSATRPPSQQSTKVYVDAVADSVIGVGQTWQDLTGSRVVNTSYQNTTGRPIQLSISADGDSGGLRVSEDNITFVLIAVVPNASGDRGVINVIIPDNTYYKLDTVDSLSLWAELR